MAATELDTVSDELIEVLKKLGERDPKRLREIRDLINQILYDAERG